MIGICHRVAKLAPHNNGAIRSEVAVPVPAHIADRVTEALEALYRHPDQTLLAWYRYAIYHALLAEKSRASYAVRVWIDVLSVQHVSFCWQPYARKHWHATWPQPDDLLELAEQTMRGAVDMVMVQREITRAEALADVIGEDVASTHYVAWCVFEAALRALQSAWIYLTYSIASASPNSSTSEGLGLDDASCYAAIAIAGGLVHSQSNVIAPTTDGAASERAGMQLRRTFFWEWWLREAIPQAWQRSYE